MFNDSNKLSVILFFVQKLKSLDIKGIVEMALQNKEENKSDETLMA